MNPLLIPILLITVRIFAKHSLRKCLNRKEKTDYEQCFFHIFILMLNRWLQPPLSEDCVVHFSTLQFSEYRLKFRRKGNFLQIQKDIHTLSDLLKTAFP